MTRARASDLRLPNSYVLECRRYLSLLELLGSFSCLC